MSIDRPKVITDLLAVDDTGTVACYIRRLETVMLAQAALLARADSLLSLMWHRHVPQDRKPPELEYDVNQTIGDLRKTAKAAQNRERLATALQPLDPSQ